MSTDFRLREDLWAIFDGVPMRVDRELALKYVLKRPTGEEVDVHRQDVPEYFRTGRLRAAEDTDPATRNLDGAVKASLTETLDGFSDQARAAAVRAKKYLDYLSSNEIRTRSVTKELLAGIAAAAMEFNDSNPPSSHTIVSWVRRQFREGSAELGIIPRYDRRGGVSRRRADAEVLQIIHDLIDTQILCPVPKSVRQLHEATQREIGSRNCTRAEGGKLKIPSYATVRRIVREYSPYEIMVAQRGRAAADAHFRWGREKFRPERLLQEVQVDDTVFDAIAVDDDGKTIGRPTLTVVLETRNRVVLGRYLGFEPASWRTVMRALCHAILPKPQTLPEVAQSNSWKMYGRFETLVMDNGKEFLSNAMHKAAIELGFQLSYCARKRPWAKGAVERFFRTLNTGLIHRLPGTTFSNPAQRGAYDSKGEARLTLGQMRVLLDKWIVEEYHQRIHRTLGITPAQSWEISAQSWPPRLPASAWAVRTAFGNPLRCKVDHSGIKLHVNQHYNSENLGSLRRQLGTELELDVKYFPEDISSIGVRDPISNQYIEVPNTDPVYSGGLSLEQHELLRRRDGTGTTALKGQLPVSMDIDAAVQSSVEFTAKQRAAMQGSSEPNLPLGGNETPRNSAARMKQQLEKRIQSLLKSQEGVEPQTLEVTHV